MDVTGGPCGDCRMCRPADAGGLLVRFFALTNVLGMLLSACAPKCPRCGHLEMMHSAGT